MLIVELYCASVLSYYACCAAVLICAKSTTNYTRNKDIKNACMNLETKIKSSALLWGGIWPIWLAKLWIRK